MRIYGFLMAAFLLLASPVQAQTFKIATLAPDGSSWMNEMRAAAKEINERTEGRVEFKFYPGGVMGNDSQILRRMRYQLFATNTGRGQPDFLEAADRKDILVRLASRSALEPSFE